MIKSVKSRASQIMTAIAQKSEEDQKNPKAIKTPKGQKKDFKASTSGGKKGAKSQYKNISKKAPESPEGEFTGVDKDDTMVE